MRRTRPPGTRWLLGLAGAVAFAGCRRLDALGSSSADGGQTPAASSSAGVEIGRQIRMSLYRITVDGVRQCPPTSFEQPDKGHVWAGVEVSLEALTATPVPANPFYARLTDADGRSYRARFNGCKPALSHAPLARGVTAHGLVTFEIREHASGLVFRYDPHVPGHQDQEAHFDLGR